MKDQIVFVVRNEDSFTTRLYKKVRLFNAVLLGCTLAIKLYEALIDIEEINQKGE